MGELGRTGAVGGEQRLHVVPGRRAHELAAHLGDHVGDRLGVVAAQRLAREDHGTGVDVVGVDAGRFVGGVDDVAHRAIVDARLALVRRQRHGRLVERLAVHHEVAAREVLGHPPHRHPREDHLRARGADVDADRDELDVVLQPERVVLEVVIAQVVVIVVVVVLALGMGVQPALAHQVIGERVLLRADRLGHQIT